MPSNHLILYCPLLLLPSIFPSIRVFSNESTLRIRWPKYWSFSFSSSPSNEYSGRISFRIDWFHLLAVQGTLKNLLQHCSLKASILWHSAFFMAQLSHLYMTTGKTIALTIWTFIGKVMCCLGLDSGYQRLGELLFNGFRISVWEEKFWIWKVLLHNYEKVLNVANCTFKRVKPIIFVLCILITIIFYSVGERWIKCGKMLKLKSF